MKDLHAIIPKTVAVVDGEGKRVALIDLLDLIEEVAEGARNGSAISPDRAASAKALTPFSKTGSPRDIRAIIPPALTVLDGDNKEVSVIDLFDLIEEVREAAQEMMRGEPGRNGRDGKDGLPGKDGAAGRDGDRGLDGIAGRDGLAGINGRDGLPPAHEIDLAKPGIRFRNPDGSWGEWVIPPTGKAGKGGGNSGWFDTRPLDDNSHHAANTEWVRGYVGSLGISEPKGPAFTYTGDLLTRIDYDDASYKLLDYTGDLLSQIDFVRGAVTYRKTFNYSGDVLTSIDETTIP